MKTEKIAEFVNRRENRFSGGEQHPAAFHSRSYHCFFEDWAEVQRTDENGHTKIERVYVGTWYIHPLQKIQKALLLTGYFLGWLLSLALFIWGASQPFEINSIWYVTIFEAAAAAALFWMFISLFHYMAAPQKMTINSYRSSSSSLRNSALTSAASLAVTSAATIIRTLISLPDSDGKRWLCAASFLLSGILCFIINQIENRIQYNEELSDQIPPEGSSMIE